MVGQSAIVKNGGTVDEPVTGTDAENPGPVERRFQQRYAGSGQGRAEASEAYYEGSISLTRTRPAGVIARHSRKLAAAVFASSVALWALAVWVRRRARTPV